MPAVSFINPACLTCAIVNGQLEPPGGTIVKTAYFHAHQDITYPIAGLVILAAKKHIRGLDEFKDAELRDFIFMAKRIRTAQRQVLKVEHVYYFYNEDTLNHFHLWLVPRYEWMQSFGRSIESVRPALLHASEHFNTLENRLHVAQVAKQLKAVLYESKI